MLLAYQIITINYCRPEVWKSKKQFPCYAIYLVYKHWAFWFDMWSLRSVKETCPSAVKCKYSWAFNNGNYNFTRRCTDMQSNIEMVKGLLS
jgi:hypothetical protein